MTRGLPAAGDKIFNAIRRLRLLQAVLWGLAMSWLSLVPTPPQLPGVLGWDKLLHAAAYGLLSVLLARYLLTLRRLAPRQALVLAWLLTVCFGILLEILQLVTSLGRTAEWLDIAADAAGALLCCVVFRLIALPRSGHPVRSEETHG